MLLFSIKTYGQTGFTDKCQALKYFLNSKEVDSWFKKPISFQDSTVYFLDPDSLLISCDLKSWMNCTVVIINSGEIIDSLKNYDFHYLINKRFNYYQLRESHIKDQTTLVFHRGHDNLSSSVQIKKKKKKYFLSGINSGVFYDPFP